MPQQRKIILGLVVRTSFEGRTIETHCPSLCWTTFKQILWYLLCLYEAGYVIFGSKCGLAVGVLMAVGYDEWCSVRVLLHSTCCFAQKIILSLSSHCSSLSSFFRASADLAVTLGSEHCSQWQSMKMYNFKLVVMLCTNIKRPLYSFLASCYYPHTKLPM